jgi:hypothetical protein
MNLQMHLQEKNLSPGNIKTQHQAKRFQTLIALVSSRDLQP